MEDSAWSDESQLLDWQRLAFENTDDPSKKADVIRRQLAALVVSSCHKNKNGLPLHFALEMERLHREYSSCMDERDPSKGVNNYAESVQALLPKHYTSTSQQWRSALTKDSFLELGPVKEALRDSKLDFSQLKLRSSPPAQLLGQAPSLESGGLSESGSTTPASIVATTRSFPPQSAVTLGAAHPTITAPLPPYTRTTPTAGVTTLAPSFGHTERSQLSAPLAPPQPHGRSVHNPPFSTLDVGVHCRETAARGSGYSRATRDSTSGDPHSGWDHGGLRPGGKSFNYPKNVQRKRRQGHCHPQEEGEEDEDPRKALGDFITARDQFHINKKKKFGSQGHCGGSGWEGTEQDNNNLGAYGSSKRSLGPRRGFVPPLKRQEEEDAHEEIRSRVLCGGPPKGGEGGNLPPELQENERLKNIEPRMVELIANEIMDHSSPVQWSDIAGLERAKKTVTEAVIWPLQRPDLFTGLRGPPKGILLFGPPGTGKTLIGKCIANTVQATFFSISASSLTSKWVGEGEKMVRALFAVAGVYQPAVIFIDEIDSLLSQRSDSEHEASRRIKTEFLVQLDGAATSSEDRILVVGATNRPQEIDEAARRRLVKRLYIPLPDLPARQQIVSNLLKEQKHSLSEEEMEELCRLTDGYSGADMANLCRDASYWPLRSLTDITGVTIDQVRPITFEDFKKSLQTVKPSVSSSDLDMYIKWNNTYGS